MPDTWVTDLKHFLNANGLIAPTSGSARKLAEHFTAIVVELTAELAEIEGIEQVACRRRPGYQPCKGFIESWIDPETGEIPWQCPKCGDNGYIRNWEGTMWDLTEDTSCH